MTEVIRGGQVVSRVGSVLRALSTSPTHGLTTAEIAGATGLSRPTVHRLLAALLAEGFVDREASDARWHVGPELYLLGTLAADRYDVTELARESVRALAELTGESAFFSARRGDETICLMREDGSFPIRSFVLYEGVRFPLGVASAGLAVLAYLPEDEMMRYTADDRLVERFGPRHSGASIRNRIAVTRNTGYALNPGLILEGSWGMGATVFDAAGRPAYALSLTGVESRFRPERHQELGALLLQHAHLVTQRLKSATRA
ncbi:IclR family transcriptional regulator [Subtercola frigoramans]|uniref:DNA-binding IclR family transcriptional regulator n=1 Tax=Subtercola frigoramans TaxID=120298 RepID=A0ABS2L2D1_9MICO|nr:IclR family transcriptional regulator [Subtercola frigoramans]MBM7471239.1 DNA-binding IclR family transcriptional regulator [Subtercola frigoramans]